MEYEKIKDLIDDMGNSKLTKISMKKEEKTVLLEATDRTVTKISNEKTVTEEVVNSDKKIEEGNIIKSPMVGTFYAKPSPDSEPYVEVGKNVKKGDVVCIIEAMKLMNEIESEFDGEIAEILVKDGEPVEYGKPLFRVK